MKNRGILASNDFRKIQFELRLQNAAIMHISMACPGGTPPGHPGTLKKYDSNALIPPPSPRKCVSQTALPLGLRIK
jgi:hypothetical protein